MQLKPRVLRFNWPIALVLLVLFISALFFLLKLEIARLVSDILSDRYDGRGFLYWALYHDEIYAFVPPIGFLVYLVFLGFRRLNKQAISKVPIFDRGFFLLLATSLGTCSLLLVTIMGTESPAPRHYASAQIEDLTFRLSAIHALGESAYLLSECDNLGLICHVEYILNTCEYCSGSYEEPFNEMRLIVDAIERRPVLSLEIDGEVVYLTSP